MQTELIVCRNKVLLNLHMRYMEAIQLYHFHFFECKISERVLLTGALSICKRFSNFHAGVKLR